MVQFLLPYEQKHPLTHQISFPFGIQHHKTLLPLLASLQIPLVIYNSNPPLYQIFQPYPYKKKLQKLQYQLRSS
uniref:Uncharacterized protein n=1 Tax=Manihot esculenta TaxID=3983 RepID=A0A251L9C1_MANES